MKRLFFLLATAIATAAQADILYSFDFNTDGPLAGQGTWTVYSGTGTTITNGGGAAWLGGGGEDIGATNSYATQSGQVYAGLTLNVTDNGSDGQYVFGFMTGNGTMVGRMWVTNQSASTYRLGLSGDGTTPTYLDTDLNHGTNYRIVLGYDNSANEHTLWVNPLATEELTPDLTLIEDVVSNPNGIFFRQTTTWGSGLASWSVDDLVVASDFVNAVSVVPEPGTLAFIALGAAMLYRRRRMDA